VSISKIIAGVDEAGRGPLAGPVFAAAVIFKRKQTTIIGLKDSKKLSKKNRGKIFLTIMQLSFVGIGNATVAEIDKYNILQATLLAMQRAIFDLKVKPNHVLVDGMNCPKVNIDCKAIVRGDTTVPEIMAASIIAKVTRDKMMGKMDKKYPSYGFKKHFGYGTKQHIKAILESGITPIHRRSFNPIHNMLNKKKIITT